MELPPVPTTCEQKRNSDTTLPIIIIIHKQTQREGDSFGCRHFGVYCWMLVCMMSVGSAQGDTDFLLGQDAGDEETDLFLVVVANGIDPVSLVLLSRMHVVHQSGDVVHGPPVFHLTGFVVQVGDGLVEGFAVTEWLRGYRPQTMRFFPMRFWTKRLKAWFIIN